MINFLNVVKFNIFKQLKYNVRQFEELDYNSHISLIEYKSEFSYFVTLLAYFAVTE